MGSSHFHRRSIRLKGYDYSNPGLYYITINTLRHYCMFGQIIDKQMILNEAGHMLHKEWLALNDRFHGIKLHDFIIMPNHFHSIIEIVEPNFKLSIIIDAFKSISTVNYIHNVRDLNWKPFAGKLWQRNYYEHIIRDEIEFQYIRQYIIDNPSKWFNHEG